MKTNSIFFTLLIIVMPLSVLAQSGFPLSVYSGKTISTLNKGDSDWRQEFLAGINYPVIISERWQLKAGLEYRLLDFFGEAATTLLPNQSFLPPESELGHEVMVTVGYYYLPPVDIWGFYGLLNTGIFYRYSGEIKQQIECTQCAGPGIIYLTKTVGSTENVGAVLTAGGGIRYNYSFPDQFFAEFRTIFLTNVNELQLQIIAGLTF